MRSNFVDFTHAPAQKHGQVFVFPSNFYAQWRTERGLVSALREDDSVPPEKLLQAVWQHQRLRRAELATLDGRTVRILHPGFWNREGGPDFRDAVVQFDNTTPISGDIEVDLQANGWHAHGHDINPNFKNVILHVIWDGGGISTAEGISQKTTSRFAPLNPGHLLSRPSATLSSIRNGGEGRGEEAPRAHGEKITFALRKQSELPTLAIADKVDAPIAELGLWLNSENGESLPEQFRGQCCPPLRDLPDEAITELLRQAAQSRFHAKAAQFLARARQAGWEQSLWEGIFRALGYKRNVWPMQCLGENRQRWTVGESSTLILQARLLGLAGLLPTDLTRAQASADNYLRNVWDCWWREREGFADCLLPRQLWQFHGQRPANHPQRRLALAANWISAGKLVANIERWCGTAMPEERYAPSLLETLQVAPDEFWSWHWTIRSPRLKKPQPLLGAARVTDLAVNVILPWLWIRAAEGKNAKLQREIEKRYDAWPAAEDNSILKLARQRLLGGAACRLLKTAAEQQGLIQIERDFCEHSNAICENCRFPDLVKEFRATVACGEPA